MSTNTIPAGAFKQGCLRILDEVAETHGEVVITKRGKPVAKLVPVEQEKEREEEILAKLRGKARMLRERAGVPAAADVGGGLGSGRKALNLGRLWTPTLPSGGPAIQGGSVAPHGSDWKVRTASESRPSSSGKSLCWCESKGSISACR